MYNEKMNQTLAGIIFIGLWVVGLLVWGNSKDIQPDYSNRNEVEQPCKVNGHPLWTDC